VNSFEVKNKLKAFIADELLNRTDYPIGDDEPLISGGWIDSFSLAQIGVFVEEAFDVYIPDPDLTVAKMDTLNQIAERVLQG
jgi:acyl carrier protein